MEMQNKSQDNSLLKSFGPVTDGEEGKEYNRVQTFESDFKAIKIQWKSSRGL